MSSMNGFINNAQRKALVDVIKVKFGFKKKNVQNQIDGLMDSTVEYTKKKLGYNIIKKEIQSMTEKIELLKKKLEEMGFDQYGNLRTTWDTKTGRYLPVSSVANKLISGKIRETTEDIDNKQQDVVSKMWLATTDKEAKNILNTIRI